MQRSISGWIRSLASSNDARVCFAASPAVDFREKYMRPTPHDARIFALAAHGDQRYGERPYAYHLDMVARLLAPFGADAQMVGFLHDTIEDTSVTQEDIESAFGTHIAGCVAILTDEPGPDRKTRKTLTYAKMAAVGEAFELALIVKAADRLANARSCVDDDNATMLAKYRSEHPAFRPAVHRPGLCDALWRELDALLSE
jgi:guanosine-3',5'-bis(diphosphate) 3'-pyrophosphohydrolase